MPGILSESTEFIMQKNEKPGTISLATAAILTLEEIKSAVECFDRGDHSVFDSLDTIIVAVEAYQSMAVPRRAAA
ncbi:MAG: hypothetical protein ACKOTB_06190 [Planctomycetia bacterium]